MESKNDRDKTNERVGNYIIQRPLGKGEFGRVYLACDARREDQLVAIKLFDAKEFLSQLVKESFFKSFFEEAEILKKLDHDYILGFYEASLHNDTPYLVIEYAPNGSLRERIAQHHSAPFPLQEAITILEQIGAALYYAHEQQVIHSDLKPENILFNASDDALLADFGIASKQDVAQFNIKPIGMRHYMSPEELHGKRFMESDQYALGIIAYELFTGHVPFTKYEAIKREKPKPLREHNPALPDYVEGAVLKAIEKQRSNRHENVSLFIAGLKGTQEKTEIFDVFLSYSKEDEDWAEDLAIRLKNEKSINVWFKKWKMRPGRPTSKVIEEGFKQSKCYAICIGANVPTEWVEKELQKALDRQTRDPFFGVIPIYLQGAKDLNSESFLDLNTSVDYRDSDPEYAFYLLVCGITDTDPGIWKPEPSSVVDKRSATEIELQELKRLETKGLIKPEEASERRSQILQRPLASDSIESRLELIQLLRRKGLINDEVAKERMRQISDEI